MERLDQRHQEGLTPAAKLPVWEAEHPSLPPTPGLSLKEGWDDTVARMLAPDSTVIETGIEGVRSGRERVFKRNLDGTYHVSNPSDISALKQAGYTFAGVDRPSTRGGFTCEACGFHAWFTTCSRCGGECAR